MACLFFVVPMKVIEVMGELLAITGVRVCGHHTDGGWLKGFLCLVHRCLLKSYLCLEHGLQVSDILVQSLEV